LLSFGSQKGIHIFQRNIVETTILFASQPKNFFTCQNLIPMVAGDKPRSFS